METEINKFIAFLDLIIYNNYKAINVIIFFLENNSFNLLLLFYGSLIHPIINFPNKFMKLHKAIFLFLTKTFDRYDNKIELKTHSKINTRNSTYIISVKN